MSMVWAEKALVCFGIPIDLWTAKLYRGIFEIFVINELYTG